VFGIIERLAGEQMDGRRVVQTDMTQDPGRMIHVAAGLKHHVLVREILQ
jgi:hypothetical protein